VVDVVIGVARVDDGEIGWVNFVAYVFSRTEGRRVGGVGIAVAKADGGVTDCVVREQCRVWLWVWYARSVLREECSEA